MIEINKSWKLKIKIFKKNNYVIRMKIGHTLLYDINIECTTNDFINIKTNFQIIYFISIL